MVIVVYAAWLLPMTYLVGVAQWGSAYLSAIIIATYFAFRPARILHPNNMLFAFYGLYVVLSSTLNLVLHLLEWDYVLPWGQHVYWNDISKYVLLQAEFTFLVLFFSFRHFCRDASRVTQVASSPHAYENLLDREFISKLCVWNVILVLCFLQLTAGIDSWITDYSYTYLAKRKGYGLLNVICIAVGNVVIFLMGVSLCFSKDKLRPLMIGLAMVFLQAYMNGFKGRLIFLLILFFSPYLLHIRLSVKTLLASAVLFFTVLYLATLVRSEGFYASPAYFLEMLIGYFNAHQLHDYVVVSRDPGLFQTVWQIFVKPLQVLGLVGPNESFDISIMLTKEFFPSHWELESATQQWPLDTELYLNYYGFYLSWLPLLLYAFFVSKLYTAGVSRQNLWVLPIFMMEFQRIFSALRGTLIPWEVFIYVVQYAFTYFVCRRAIAQRQPSNASQTLLKNA
nr:hypothetical protein [uncultured Caldimonas sp.]